MRRNWYLFIVLSEYIVSKQRFDFETANLQNISNLFFCNLCKQYLGRMSLKIITGDMNYLIVWKSFTIHRCNILPSVLKFLTSVFYNFIFVSLPNQSHTGGGGEPVTDNGCFSASLPPPLPWMHIDNSYRRHACKYI